MQKIKLSQKAFEELYVVEGITEETPATVEDAASTNTKEEDTTPEFLTEEEQSHDDKLAETLNWQEEEDK